MANTDLRQADFAATFNFTRPVAASYRGEDGVVRNAAKNVPRFHYDAAGVAVGLIVGMGGALGQGDRLSLKEIALPEELDFADVTILHRFRRADAAEAQTVRRAYYTRDARMLVDALLTMDGWHAEIGVVPGFLRNKGGFVRFRLKSWYLPVLIATGDGGALSDEASRPLLGA